MDTFKIVLSAIFLVALAASDKPDKLPPNAAAAGNKNNGNGQGNGRGACRSQTVQFFNLAQRTGALSTGSFRGAGLRYSQDFRELCTDVALREYRTVDGSCNHPKNWGASFKPVSRMLNSEYEDGIGAPRVSGVDGTPLPSPRLVSRLVHPDVTDLLSKTLMVMQWGQWLDHDVTGFPVATESDRLIRCCGANGTRISSPLDKNCFPIVLPPEEDNFVGSCMEFIRSIPAASGDGCELSPREQVNSLTSFVDASQIYGSTEEVAAKVRDGKSYLLKTKNGGFLPESDGGCITRPGTGDYCFLAGDIRVNEHPALGSLHTLWMREHNRIARTLARLRPRDSEEQIFQLTRKIIGALQQVITYNEWLPIILGKQAAQLKLPSKTGRTTRNNGVDPRILNEFSTAAMRFGHSLIPTVFPIGNRRVPLRELFNRPAEVLENLEDVIVGIVGMGTPGLRNAQKIDRNFVGEITNHLFEPLSGPPGRGLDLISLNIQRARDHGIPPYTAYRALCGLRPLTGFNDVEALGPNVAQLARVYKSVDDIDLFTGLVHEPVEEGTNAIVGPTLSCILGTQFYNLKYGDRFFFDTDETAIAFTNDQLKSLRNTSLAHIICANTNIPFIQPDVFKFPTQKANAPVECKTLVSEGLNLALFA
ncbi:chorion peroxidase-like [Physella acuta]|uniref:chorion peroxidase-like n=1 Tax=Physella acuta TaxID=109671 RepID=UPI0027DDFBD2|nr:chorion peroxidase-like [Physella acuta]